MSANIGIDRETRQRASDSLGMLLADEALIAAEARGDHWNVVGREFSSLHELFESQYQTLDALVEQVAERLRPHHRWADGSFFSPDPQHPHKV